MTHIFRNRKHAHVIPAHALAERAHLANINQRLVIPNLIHKLLQILAVSVGFVVGEEDRFINLLDLVDEGQGVELLVSLIILVIEAIILICLEKINSIGHFAISVPTNASRSIFHIQLLRIVRNS